MAIIPSWKVVIKRKATRHVITSFQTSIFVPYISTYISDNITFSFQVKKGRKRSGASGNTIFRVGRTVVRALASRRCRLGSIPGTGIICGLSLLLVLSLLREVFLRVLRFFPLLKKPTFLNPNSIQNGRRRTTLLMCYHKIVINRYY